MRETSLRWGLGMGAVGSALGIIAQLVSAQFLPHGAVPFDQEIRYLLIAGPLALIALGVALGLSYFAGLRAEGDRLRDKGEEEVDPLRWGGERRDSALAGGVVMAAYWLITGLYSTVLSLRTPNVSISGLLTQHAIQGVLFILFGAGLGAMGGRAPAARSLLDELTAPPSALDELAAPPSALDALTTHPSVLADTNPPAGATTSTPIGDIPPPAQESAAPEEPL